MRMQSALMMVRNNTGMSTMEVEEQRRSRRNDFMDQGRKLGAQSVL